MGGYPGCARTVEARILPPMITSPGRSPREPDEAAFPEPPGGGVAIAVVGGISASGAVFLVFVPPLVIAWLLIAAVLAGIAVRRTLHVATATLAALTPSVACLILVQCLTGAWAWLLAGIILFTVVTIVGVPVGFGIGRLLRNGLANGYPVIRVVLVATAILAVVGWLVVIANALMPGSCTPAA